MKVVVKKPFSFSFDGINTMHLKPGETHDMDPRFVQGLRVKSAAEKKAAEADEEEDGFVEPVEGEDVSVLETSPLHTTPPTIPAPAYTITTAGQLGVVEHPKSANDDGTSKAQHHYVEVEKKLMAEEATVEAAKKGGEKGKSKADAPKEGTSEDKAKAAEAKADADKGRSTVTSRGHESR